jgi:hypothetical protein
MIKQDFDRKAGIGAGMERNGMSRTSMKRNRRQCIQQGGKVFGFVRIGLEADGQKAQEDTSSIYIALTHEEVPTFHR